MLHRTHPSPPRPRGGVAAVELALLLPFLCFLFVIAVDFARAFYFSLTLANCARNGALYLSDDYARAESPYQSVEEAALADAANLNNSGNPPQVKSATGTDGAGYPYVEVTVTWQFQTITNFPGVPNAVSMSRTVRMRQAPPNPPTT